MISFDTNILVYATASGSDAKALRARDLIARAMRSGWAILYAANPCGVRQYGDPQGWNTDGADVGFELPDGGMNIW
jgi:hypothetical protein